MRELWNLEDLFIILFYFIFCYLNFFSVLSFLFQKLENGLWVFWQFKKREIDFSLLLLLIKISAYG